MENLKTLSDSQLLTRIRLDAENERRSGLAVIHQLREVARRRLDARLGYPSLHRYCMDELKYSPGSAWRRIKAMEALEEIPELESKITQGELTLANVSQVQSFCDQTQKTLEEKKEILKQVSGLSKRETERQLARLAPLPERPDKVRPVGQDSTELRVTLTAETLAELEKVRDLLAHSHPGASYGEVIAFLAKLGLRKLDPAHPKPRPEKCEPDILPPGENTQVAPGPSGQARTGATSRAVPAATRRAVWQRDRGKCGFVSAATGRVCGATAFMQLDHIVPRAKGGGHEPSNLRLRCQRHNLLAAVDEFGEAKVTAFLRKKG